MPPASLRVLVGGSADTHWFLNFGSSLHESLRQIMAQQHVRLEDLKSVLEFGCGCGRVLRHWAGVKGPKIHGCDYNARLADWSRNNLGFANIAINQAAPPLPYEDASFDFIYAISVFTHLSADLQVPWFQELSRVTMPGGMY
ncbi:class I SAM-dependent methyltransferase [Asticcacaulis sp. SL142]|uniref:class I SAM-dependent methyltransferase n=1 Tax=Asticcacaulis sp. SL142 TaxID=2995155 RepID=UPI00226CA11C|nr:class I SAM-dependent methyltransferase [Asticcacaulis sp. SL142]WAC48347.1 class I SAM-dependent methyltransferase [Asticcacaulis sp. SL142]